MTETSSNTFADRPRIRNAKLAADLVRDNKGIRKDIAAPQEMIGFLISSSDTHYRIGGALPPATESVLKAIEALVDRYVRNTLVLADHGRGQDIPYSALRGE